jgi:hypothetical protein
VIRSPPKKSLSRLPLGIQVRKCGENGNNLHSSQVDGWEQAVGPGFEIEICDFRIPKPCRILVSELDTTATATRM